MTRTKFLFVLLFVLLTMPAALRAGDIIAQGTVSAVDTPIKLTL